MDAFVYVGLVGIAALAALVYALVVALLIFGAYYLLYSRKVSYLSDFTGEDVIYLNLVWVWTAILDVLAYIITIGATLFSTIVGNLSSNFLLYIGLFLFLIPSIWWIEYHPEVIEVAVNLYQCTLKPFLFEGGIYQILNSLRLLYDAFWPFLRLSARVVRYWLRTAPFLVFQCAAGFIPNTVLRIANAAAYAVIALGEWFATPPEAGGFFVAEYNGTLAITELLSIADDTIEILDCVCDSLGFIWRIALGWVNSDATVFLVNSAINLGLCFFVQIPLRTLVGRNPGTVPAVTSDYGIVPNIDCLFDGVQNLIRGVGSIINRFVYVAVRELVGLANPGLFVPGSPEEVVLVSDIVGFAVYALCAVVDAVRFVKNLWYLGGFAILNLIFGGAFGATGVNVLCDMREVRALVDMGGVDSLYWRELRIFGQLRLAASSVGSIALAIDPLAQKLVEPPLLVVVDTIGLFANGAWRVATHFVDDEYRMYNPALPPRTPYPLVASWSVPPSYGPPPIPCPVVFGTSFVPGNLFVWVQDYIDDPLASHQQTLGNFQTFGEGLNELASLAWPPLGALLEKLVLVVVYTVDFVVQTLAFLNTVLFEPDANTAQFFARWRYARWLTAVSDAGTALKDLVQELEPAGSCAVAANARNFFCCLGRVFEAVFELPEQVVLQLFVLIESVRIPPLVIPNFEVAIDKLEVSLQELVCALVRIVVPPWPFDMGSDTLSDAVEEVLVTLPPIAVLILRVPNFAIKELESIIGAADITPQVFGAYAEAVVDYLFDRLRVTAGDGFLVKLGEFFDRFITIEDGLFAPIAIALVQILDTIRTSLQELFFLLLAPILRAVSALIKIFFGGSSSAFAQGFANLATAIGEFLKVIVTKIPTFFLDLIFELLNIILPPPINTIVVAFLRLLIDGICNVLQVFLDVAIDTINFFNIFGDSLASINLCCSGGACAAKKRTAAHQDAFDNPLVAETSERLRNYIRESLSKARMPEGELSKRIEKMRRVILKHQNRKRATNPLERTPTEETDTPSTSDDDTWEADVLEFGFTAEDRAAAGGINPYTFEHLIYANDTYRYANVTNPPIEMTMDEGYVVLGEIVDWDGGSSCELLVRTLIATKKPDEFTLMESIQFQDCVTRRAFGEILHVLPAMSWFPVDGFYSGFRWLQLLGDSIHAYRVYSQFQSDHITPREGVLSDVYREFWAKHGLVVDHLTEANYYNMMTNMTLRDYFVRNGANMALADSVLGAWEHTKDVVRDNLNYLGNLSAVVDADAPSALELWVSGEQDAIDELPMSVKLSHDLYRAWLRGTGRVIEGATDVQTIYHERLGVNLLKGVTETAKLVHRSYKWLRTPATPSWEDALKQHREELRQQQLHTPHMFEHGWETDDASGNPYAGPQEATLRERMIVWVRERLGAFATMLRPNDEHAKRNWRYITHWVAELYESALPSHASAAGRYPWGDVEVSQTEFNTWLERVQLVDLYNHRLPTTSWRPRHHVATYATGEQVLDANGVMVDELALCDGDVVPVCLGCTILDGFLAELFTGFDELIAYFEVDGPFAQQLDDFNTLNAYFVDETINVCGGDGTQEIHWPSDFVLYGNTTVFDVFGGSGGILSVMHELELRGYVEAGSASLAAGTVQLTTAGVRWMAHVAFNNHWTERAPTEGFFHVSLPRPVHAAATESRIQDYAANLTTFDLTYTPASLLGLTLLYPALDELGDIVVNIDIDYALLAEAIRNQTLFLNVTGIENSTVGYLYETLIVADYAYTCDQRNLTFLQGLLLTLLVTVVVLLTVQCTCGLFFPPITTFVALIWLPVALFFFFVVTYALPIQNLMLIPVPPPCLADDAINSLACELLPKCPAIVAGLMKEPYTEATCATCPLQNEVLHCKYDAGIRDAIDVVFVVLQWLSPSAADGFGGILTTISPEFQERVDRFAALDFGDKATFDTYISCLLYVGWATLAGGLAILAGGFLVVVVAAVALLGALLPLFVIFAAMLSTLYALLRALLYNFVYIVPEKDLTRMEEFVITSAVSQGWYADSAQGLAPIQSSSKMNVARRRIRRLERAARKRSAGTAFFAGLDTVLRALDEFAGVSYVRTALENREEYDRVIDQLQTPAVREIVHDMTQSAAARRVRV